jgi:hypothetical protein
MSACYESAPSVAASPSAICNSHPLNDKWVLYNHLPSEKDWTITGYTVLLDHIDSVEKTVAINRSLPDNMVKFSMLFFMRDGITPLWEDESNKNGGCFSYKVVNKHVVQVWRHMMFMAAGESLALTKDYSACINGITLSPKKNFCIVKIWLKDANHQDPQMIANIENLTKHGVMFKRHGES